MGLSGSDKAYQFAIADVCRADATRSGYFNQKITPVRMNGVARQGVIQQSIRIDLNTGDEPHRASFDYRGGSGYIPQAGHTCTIAHGTLENPLFVGRMVKVRRRSIRNADGKPVYQIEAAGWLFDFNISRARPGIGVTSMAPRSIVGLIFDRSEPALSGMGFTYADVPYDLPVAAEFTLAPTEPIASGLSRLFRGVDATWYVDHNKGLHAFASVNSLSTGVPSTITSDTDKYWGIDYAPTDVSRVFAHVQVLGQQQQTLFDVDASYHKAFPLPSAEGLHETITDLGSPGAFATWDGSYLVGWEGRDTRLQTPPIDRFQTPESHMRAGKVSTFLPASAHANTLTVAAANVSSMSPLVEARWYSIAGQWVYVASVLGVYSLTASSVAYNYFVPSSASGAMVADIQAQADIAPTWNFVPCENDPFQFTDFPAGTRVQIMAEFSGNSPVGSLVPDYAAQIEDARYWTRTFEDARLSPFGVRQVASEALQRGAVSAWQSLEFQTRERYADIGRPVYVSITSPAEPGGHSIVGTFTAQDVTIDGFGTLTAAKGPIRTVRAGTVRRPTLWQILQGE